MATAFLEPLLAAAASGGSTNREWLAGVREQALRQLARDGLPGPRSEAWKYSSLRALGQRRFEAGDAAAATRNVDAGLLELAGVEGPRLVFVNGSFRADLSRLPSLPGVELRTLSQELRDDADGLRGFLDRVHADPADVFARLNTVLAADGPVIRVAAGIVVEPLVHLVIVGASASADLAWQLRGIVELGAGASLRLVEHHVGEAGHGHFGNSFIQILLRAENQRQAGICVLKKSCGGRATIHSTKSASIKARRISPSPLCPEDMEPLARTKPACPVGARWCSMC